MEIMKLTPELKKRAAGVVAAAFFDYPSIVCHFPDLKRRKRVLPWFMDKVLNTAQTFGEAYITADASGVLFALLPGHTRLNEREYVRCGFLPVPLVMGLRHYHSHMACEDYIADTQEKLLAGRPHYYIWGLAVEPAKQRTGAGKALLQSFLKKSDEEAVPVYLETHQQRNVAYYEKAGFELIHQDVIPGCGLDFWCFLHEPDGV